MKLIIEKDYNELSKRVADILKTEIKANPQIVLGLATGSTPIGAYKELIKLHKEEELDFSEVKTFNLDEYIGLSGNHPNSYRHFMNEELFKHININIENVHIPNGKAKDMEEHCKEYDGYIEKAGGIDIQVLGIGTNGHIAFNEPAKELNLGTSIVDLTESTINDNARFFDTIDEVPKTAVTMGIGSILKAKKIIVLASGKSKTSIMKQFLKGNTITTNIPASLLLLHPDVTVIIDEEAYQA